MAKWTITRACRHTETHQLYGPGADREKRAEWLKSTPCTDCYRKEQAERAAEQTSNLPELTGTDKQIQWATTIRAQIVAQIESIVARIADNPDADGAAETLDDARIILKQSKASYWIDNRHMSGRDLLKRRADKRAAEKLLNQ
jgi:hypothetical protein